MTIQFTPPEALTTARHHADAAVGNTQAATEAIRVLSDSLSGINDYDKILLRAAAGAGKSVQLRRMVVDALAHPACSKLRRERSLASAQSSIHHDNRAAVSA